jgi:hypothetical protein
MGPPKCPIKVVIPGTPAAILDHENAKARMVEQSK